MNSTLPVLLSRRAKSHGVSKRLSEGEDQALMNKAVHTQHKDFVQDHKKFLDSIGRKEQHVKTVKKKVIVPVEEVVNVPVYRKEVKHKTEKVVVTGTKLVPITKYK